METNKCGKVILVGAGPGDPSLITLLGREWLQRAEVVIHDFLLNPALLAYAPDAEIISAVEPTERHPRSLERINALMVEKARQGKVVVRLKGGDPLVFGRGGEEALALVEAGIPFQIVPGVTSATAVPTYAGIPITQRGVASSLAVIAAHNLEHDEAVDWSRLAHSADTLLFLMGVKALPNIVSGLLAAGRPPDTPVAVVEQGTHPGQTTVVGALSDILGKAAGLKPPATVIVGEVVNLRRHLRWFDRPDLNPLFGLRLMTVHAGQAAPVAELSRQFTARGAEAASFSAVQLAPVSDPAPLKRVLSALAATGGASWDDLVFADAQAVASFFDALYALGGDARALAGLRLGAPSAEVAEALRANGLAADVVGAYVGSHGAGSLAGPRLLLLGGSPVESDLVAELEAQGATVETCAVYARQTAPSLQPWLNWLEASPIPDDQRVVVFTDPAAVEAMAKLLPGPALAQALAHTAVVCAGAGTAAAARAHSLKMIGETVEISAEAIAEALRPWRMAGLQQP